MDDTTQAPTAPEAEAPTGPLEMEVVPVAAPLPSTQPTEGALSLGVTLGGLTALAARPDVDVDKLERLIKLLREREEHAAKTDFFAALARFQGAVPPIRKDQTVGYYTKDGELVGYRHASLGNIAETIRGTLHTQGLSYRFEAEEADGRIRVTCIVTHAAGHSETMSFAASADTSGKKNAIQSRASTLTYMRRYTLEGALGLASTTEDTDGQGHDEGAGDNPLDDAELPPATEQTDESTSIRGPYGNWIREIRDERAEGKMTRRELLLRGLPDNWVFISKSDFEKYKPDGKNADKNAGVGRPFTCKVTDGKNVKGEVWFLCETLRHPAATGAIHVPDFNWQEAANDAGAGDTGGPGDSTAPPASPEPSRVRKPGDGDPDPQDAAGIEHHRLTADAVRLQSRIVAGPGRETEYPLRVQALGLQGDGETPKSLYTATDEELRAYIKAGEKLVPPQEAREGEEE